MNPPRSTLLFRSGQKSKRIGNEFHAMGVGVSNSLVDAVMLCNAL